MSTRLVLAAALAIAAAPAIAQQPTPQPAPEARQQTPSITRITVVDIEELPAETRTQVEQIEAQRSDQDLKSLRDSIDASPQIVAALEQKGVTSAHVIAASLGQDGALTLVTRKAG